MADIFSATPKGAANPFAIPNSERNQTPKVKVATDACPLLSPVQISKSAPSNVVSVVDSGYHGSQDLQEPIDEVELIDEDPTQAVSSQRKGDHVAFYVSSPVREIQETPVKRSPEPTATVDDMGDELDTQYFTANIAKIVSPRGNGPHHESTTPSGSPTHSTATALPQRTLTARMSPAKAPPANTTVLNSTPISTPDLPGDMGAENNETSRSPSEKSSPIRPVVRKSSLNFASLPAREPMHHKSIGNRVSRTSHLDQRNSYFNRHTGGKSLGNVRHEISDDENDDTDMDDHEVDMIPQKPKVQEQTEADITTAHNKTYTQRLQDQISKLGQSQPLNVRQSKSTASAAIPVPAASAQVQTAVPAPKSPPKPKVLSPKPHITPGAFPEDDDGDNWIEALGTPDNASNMFSPRPGMLKSFSTDMMEGVSGKDTVSGADFTMPRTRQDKDRSKSPARPAIPERTTSTFGHKKSASVPSLPIFDQGQDGALALKKTISVSNPTLATVTESEIAEPDTALKSPSRTVRDSPLKHVKNKLSSILKSSKGLLASSAALSAEGKSSLLSPSTIRLGLHAAGSTISLGQPFASSSQSLYPDLSQKAFDSQSQFSTASPARTEGRRTRASIEREKAEEKRKERDAKEAKRMAEQMDKLEKAREKEREKARVFSKEQERIAAMEKQVVAQAEQDKKAATITPAPAKPTRTSPRKAKPQGEAEEQAAVADGKSDDDIDMADAPVSMPPPSIPRPASAAKGREIKRPTRPAKETVGKSKQAPTVIRVNMGSQQTQHQPPSSVLAPGLYELPESGSLQPQPKSKASQAPMHAKSASQSLKNSQSTSGRPKALEVAARRKEQEEREAQRKRDVKAEMDRKRAALLEEEKRQEQQRKDEERRQAAAREDAKKKALLEKAKLTRAPPPASRTVNGQPDYKTTSQNSSQSSRPPSRIGIATQKSQEDFGRSIHGALANASKSTTKRPLQQDVKETKRMRMTDEFDDDFEMSSQPTLKGAPVRPSGGFKKVPAGSMLAQGQKAAKLQGPATKSMFPVGYANAPPSATKDLFKSTVTSQHNAQPKGGHPMDMAQFTKGTIPFAPNPNPAGPVHKTPARPMGGAPGKSVAKSATRSSPRFQNGEHIELPEINTDDEDEYSDDEHKEMFASWTDSPALRRALVEQETLDPMRVFGAPAPLNMEEVFSKSKDRWHKFRARTSSANWSGADRLTEDDIRKDLAARDKLRREGGWSYDMGKEML